MRSSNRVADWLRPALILCNCISASSGRPTLIFSLLRVDKSLGIYRVTPPTLIILTKFNAYSVCKPYVQYRSHGWARPCWVMEFAYRRFFFGGGDGVEGRGKLRTDSATSLRRKAFDSCKLSNCLYMSGFWAYPHQSSAPRPRCPP